MRLGKRKGSTTEANSRHVTVALGTNDLAIRTSTVKADLSLENRWIDWDKIMMSEQIGTCRPDEVSTYRIP